MPWIEKPATLGLTGIAVPSDCSDEAVDVMNVASEPAHTRNLPCIGDAVVDEPELR